MKISTSSSEESNRMSEMVNDILDYSQLQSGYIRLHPEFFDLAGLAESGDFSTAPQPPKPTGSGSILSQILSLVFITADPPKA